MDERFPRARTKRILAEQELARITYEYERARKRRAWFDGFLVSGITILILVGAVLIAELVYSHQPTEPEPIRPDIIHVSLPGGVAEVTRKGIAWGFLGAAFVGTGCAFMSADHLMGLGCGTTVAGGWCFLIALLDDVGTRGE